MNKRGKIQITHLNGSVRPIYLGIDIIGERLVRGLFSPDIYKHRDFFLSQNRQPPNQDVLIQTARRRRDLSPRDVVFLLLLLADRYSEALAIHQSCGLDTYTMATVVGSYTFDQLVTELNVTRPGDL